jgi:CTP synthase (UTP-ammonia lyase)
MAKCLVSALAADNSFMYPLSQRQDRTSAMTPMSTTPDLSSMLTQIYGRNNFQEAWLCNFDVNPDFVHTLRSRDFTEVGSDAEGTGRAMALPRHPFFVGTLFLPQHISTPSNLHPLGSPFNRACLHCRAA